MGAIAEIAGLDPAGLVRNDTAPAPGSAPRPQFERMSCGRLERLLKAAGEPDGFRADFKTSLARDLAPFLPQRHVFTLGGLDSASEQLSKEIARGTDQTWDKTETHDVLNPNRTEPVEIQELEETTLPTLLCRGSNAAAFAALLKCPANACRG